MINADWDDIRRRLDAKLDKDTPTGCWEFTGTRMASGYGHLSVRAEGWPPSAKTHRVAFYLANGYLPTVVRHTCDNPPCCNPSHLQPGTQRENYQDMVQRGRRRIGARSPVFQHGTTGTRGHACGCKECRAAINAAQQRWFEKRQGQPPEHGTFKGYDSYRCRCDECLSFYRAWWRARRLAKKNQPR